MNIERERMIEELERKIKSLSIMEDGFLFFEICFVTVMGIGFLMLR